MTMFDWLSKKPPDASIKKKDYEKMSVKLLKKGESSAKKGDLANAAYVYHMLSVLARRAGEWDDGIKYALQAASYSETEKKTFNAGWSYRSASLAAMKKGDHKSTVEYALRGAEKFLESKSVYAAQWCYKTAALASKNDGITDKAIKFYEKACSIEHDDDLKNEVYKLKHTISHPRVDQYAEKEEVVEGEHVRFEVVVENHSKETLNRISIGDRNACISHDVDKLKPGEVRIFSYETSGKVGRLHSPYNFITWESEKGDTLDFEIAPISVLVRPKIQITPHIHPDPVVSKVSKIVLLVKNLSSNTLYDIKVDIDFDENVQAPHSNPKEFDKLLPGDEYGASWSMKMGIPGKHRIARGSVTMHDDKGVKYEEYIRPVIANVADSAGPPKKAFEGDEHFRTEKAHLDRSITAYPVAQSLYYELEKQFFHQQRGYTFRNIKGSILMKHVTDNCKDMELVSEHKFEGEVMLRYSFRLENVHHLLTVVIKEDEDFVHLILKLYSESREHLDENLDRIAGIIRHTITTGTDAHEVEKVEIKKVINIIDSVVQRSKIGSGEEGEVVEKDINVHDSVVQRTKA
ncbi:MAG: sel1 repeat family protein [Candidatus Aenigmatarchaeota archaeon]|nr:MAG: sel1 repeat family protein [Candidatus Aenigmarchaeota archaeon]